MNRLKRTDVKCGLMQGCGNKGTGTIYCDKFAWEIRKLYPKDFKCCSKNGRCLGRDEGKNLRVKQVKCAFRESCFDGANCSGPNGQHCTMRVIEAEKKVKRLKKEIAPTAI